MKKLLIIIFIIFAFACNGWSANCGDGVGACACGDTLTASYTLVSDLNCPTDSPALTIGADSVTLDGDSSYQISGSATLGGWTDTGSNDEYYINDPTTLATVLTRDGIPVDRNDNDSQETAGDDDLEKGHWTLDTDSTPDRIYYRLLDTESDMSGSTWIAGQGNVIDLNQKDSVTIQNLTVALGQNLIRDDYTGVDPATNFTLSGCTLLNGSKVGMWLSSGGTVTINSNTFRYNRMSILTGAADGSPAATEAITALTISNNTFEYDRYNWDETEAGDHEIDAVPYTDNLSFTGNTIKEYGYMGGKTQTNAVSTGEILSVDGSQGFTISGNNFKDNYTGVIEFGCDANDNRNGSGGKIYSNLFSNNMRGAWSEGRWINFHVVRSVTSAGCGNVDFSILISDNTFYGNNNSDLVTALPLGASVLYFDANATSDVSGITVNDNIISENSCVHDLRVNTQNGSVTFDDGDHNDYYRSSGDYIGIGNNAAPTEYPDSNNFAAFQATAYGDSNDINSDPLFVNAAGGDFRLKPKSSAIDAGELLSIHVNGYESYYGDNRLCGDGPDIGGDEYCKSSKFPPFIFAMGGSKTSAWYVASTGSLLLETGDYLLLENGDKLLLE